MLNEHQTLALRRELRGKKILRALNLLRAAYGPTRFRIIYLLRLAGGLTVTEIAGVFGVSLSRISHQLRILRNAGLVKATGNNREVVYSLAAKRRGCPVFNV